MCSSSASSLVTVTITLWPCLALTVWVFGVILPPATVAVITTSAWAAVVAGPLGLTGGLAGWLARLVGVPPEAGWSSPPQPASPSRARAGSRTDAVPRAKRMDRAFQRSYRIVVPGRRPRAGTLRATAHTVGKRTAHQFHTNMSTGLFPA